MNIGKKRSSSVEAISTARYPLTVACDDNASIDCARLIRGIRSIASAVAPVAAMAASPSGSPSGLRKPTRIVPARRCVSSCEDGGATFAITSAPQGSPSSAPAATYCSSVAPAASPAPASTTTSCSAARRRRTTSGTRATRLSLAAVSLGTPIFKCAQP
jgi:hypothetical protein